MEKMNLPDNSRGSIKLPRETRTLTSVKRKSATANELGRSIE